MDEECTKRSRDHDGIEQEMDGPPEVSTYSQKQFPLYTARRHICYAMRFVARRRKGGHRERRGQALYT